MLTIAPKDTYHRRIFLAPIGLQLVTDAGTLAQVQVTFNVKDGSLASLTATFDEVGEQPLSTFRLRFKGYGSRGFYVKDAKLSRGSYEVVPAEQGGETMVDIAWRKT